MNPDISNQRPIEAGVVTDLSERLSYGGYLRLDRLLSAQQPISKMFPSGSSGQRPAAS